MNGGVRGQHPGLGIHHATDVSGLRLASHLPAAGCPAEAPKAGDWGPEHPGTNTGPARSGCAGGNPGAGEPSRTLLPRKAGPYSSVFPLRARPSTRPLTPCLDGDRAGTPHCTNTFQVPRSVPVLCADPSEHLCAYRSAYPRGNWARTGEGSHSRSHSKRMAEPTGTRVCAPNQGAVRQPCASQRRC